jgi:CTP synthase
MQVAVVDLARHLLHSSLPNSTEFDETTKYPVIDIMPDQRDVSEKGGTMRLGVWPCRITPGTRTSEAYGQPIVYERHRHRYEFNNEYREVVTRAGLSLSGTSPDDRLVEIVELEHHPFFVGCQFHPEFMSRPMAAHPLFSGFVAAAVDRRDLLAQRAREGQPAEASVN